MPVTREMQVEAKWVDGWQFDVTTGTGHAMTLDAAVDHGGREAGPRPMELLIAGIAGCTAMDVISVLRKMRQDVRGYRVSVSGTRREEHPMVFTHIVIEHVVEGEVDEERLAHAIKLSNDTYCSAQAMVKGVATIETRYTIVRP